MQLSTYYMLTEVRDNLDEASASHWDDIDILRKINQAQDRLWMKMSMTTGDWWLTKKDITPSNGLVELPAMCAKPVYMEHKSSGAEIPWNGTVRERRSTRVSNLQLGEVAPDFYAYGEYLEINQDGFTDQVTLWYERSIPDLITGTGDTGSTSNAIVIKTTDFPALIDDYYNGALLEVVSGTGAQTRAEVTNYVASTRLMTVSGTFSTDSVYSTFTELPQQAIPTLLLMATCLCLSKPSASIDTKYFEMFQIEKKDALNDFENWISTRVKNSEYVRVDELEY